MPTDPCHFESDLALVQFGMAGFTQSQEVRKRIFPAVFSVDNMMGLQTNPPFAALLTGVAISHQTSDAQILIQSCRVLVLTPLEFRGIEPRDIDLHVLYNYLSKG